MIVLLSHGNIVSRANMCRGWSVLDWWRASTFIRPFQNLGVYRIVGYPKCSDNGFAMKDLAETWGNAWDQDTNNLVFEARQIRGGVFEWEDFAQTNFWPCPLSNEIWEKWLGFSFKSIQFFWDSWECRYVPPRFSRENWTLVTNTRS
jgi:hypothetical protein